jgi:hypothetical protein
LAQATQPARKPVPIQGPASPAALAGKRPAPAPSRTPTPTPKDDGTRQLLQWGGWTLAMGLVCALLTKTVFGGIGPQGPHTNTGWMALIVTMMCLPFGFLLFLLGALKWLRNRRNLKP